MGKTTEEVTLRLGEERYCGNNVWVRVLAIGDGTVTLAFRTREKRHGTHPIDKMEHIILEFPQRGSQSPPTP